MLSHCSLSTSQGRYYMVSLGFDKFVSSAVAFSLFSSTFLPSTAVFAVKDMMAIGVMQAIKEAGKHIPEDMAVIGCDGINTAGLPMIDLTSVAQPKMEMAEQILNILDRHAEDPSLPAEHYLAQPRLILRGSTDLKVNLT